MAKTVFGMPGLGNKAPGDAKKPSGTAGDQSGGAPSQQSNPNSKGAASSTTGAKGPAMAKPVNTPMAKPAAAKPAPADTSEGSAKTMFGMPAMKLPKQNAPAAAPPAEEPSPSLAATQAVPAAKPAGGDGAGIPRTQDLGEGLGFNATVLGVAVNAPTAAQPAFTADAADEPPMEAPPSDMAGAEMDIAPAEVDAPGYATPEAGDPIPTPQQAPGADSFRGSDEAHAAGSKTLGIVLLGVAGLLVVVYLVLFFLWPSLTTPEPKTAPALPGTAVTTPAPTPAPAAAPAAAPAPAAASGQ